MSKFKGAPVIDAITANPVVRWEWRRNLGISKQIVRKGSFNQMVARAGIEMPNYDAITISQIGEGGMFKMELAQNGDEMTEVHEVSGTSLMQNKIFNLVLKQRFLESGITEENHPNIVSQIADEVLKKKAGNQTYDQMASAVATIGGNNAVAFELMDDLDRNGDQVPTEQATYRHTIVLAERIFQENSEFFGGMFGNRQRIFTESQLRDVESIPDDFELPPSIVAPSAPSEWLKMPTVSTLNLFQKRTITTEYLSGDEISRLYYLEY